jgi:hypothetical protein
MTTPCQIIIVPVEVPSAGSPGWLRPEKPRYRHHKASRESWKPVQPIPHFDREEILRRVEEARKAISDDRSRIEAMLGRAA